ncbi:caspase family protein, partial [bacterium]|nr:caspase family protein [bacterium]
TKAFSSVQLMDFSKNIKAQKQLFIFDACQSGGAVETFAGRGAAEEKAIIQLARSSGMMLLAAAGSQQFATEFTEIGHGVFTYAILEALAGGADGGEKDKKITVKELSYYLEDRVPQLTEKFRGEAQYPTGYSSGQDFPVVIVK